MKNVLKIDFDGKRIIMDRTFAKNCEDPRSDEYARLQAVRRDYPNFEVIRRQIKRNAKKNAYKGLTYDYMRDYILRQEPEETALEVIKEFNELIYISKCHKQSLRYPSIKKWFLDRYPNIDDFGVAA